MNEIAKVISRSMRDMTPYLIFQLNDSDYAIRVDHVREIITSVELSPVPGAPSYLSGVVNLRGRILPMVDLRNRFEFPEVVDKDRQCFVILTLELDEELIEIGVQVDSVSEVMRIHEDQIDAANSIHDFNESLVFHGVAKTDNGIKLVLDSSVLIKQLKADVRARCVTHASSSAQHLVSPEMAL